MQPKQDVSIDEIVVEVDGEVVFRFDGTMIDRLFEERNGQQGYPVLVVDRSGIRLSAEQECPSPPDP